MYRCQLLSTLLSGRSLTIIKWSHSCQTSSWALALVKSNSMANNAAIWASIPMPRHKILTYNHGLFFCPWYLTVFGILLGSKSHLIFHWIFFSSFSWSGLIFSPWSAPENPTKSVFLSYTLLNSLFKISECLSTVFHVMWYHTKKYIAKYL